MAGENVGIGNAGNPLTRDLALHCSAALRQADPHCLHARMVENA
jgi:hypothetical protein